MRVALAMDRFHADVASKPVPGDLAIIEHGAIIELIAHQKRTSKKRLVR
jgi:hypothetical protein